MDNNDLLFRKQPNRLEKLLQEYMALDKKEKDILEQIRSAVL